MDLAFLFISAFAASTILPMSSEIVLSALALGGATEVWLLLTVATTGNTLGAVVNWGIGRYCQSNARSSITAMAACTICQGELETSASRGACTRPDSPEPAAAPRPVHLCAARAGPRGGTASSR
jgi:hypothetical protein